MKVKIRRLCEEAVIPAYAHESDAGLDLVAVSKELDGMCNIVYGTGLAVEIPEGHVGLLFPRSSNSRKTLWLTNSVGVIDSGYRGEILVKFRPSISEIPPISNFLRRLFGVQDRICYLNLDEYEVGDKVAQLVIIPYPKVEFEEVDFLYPSDRNDGGFGSTGE